MDRAPGRQDIDGQLRENEEAARGGGPKRWRPHPPIEIRSGILEESLSKRLKFGAVHGPGDWTIGLTGKADFGFLGGDRLGEEGFGFFPLRRASRLAEQIKPGGDRLGGAGEVMAQAVRQPLGQGQDSLIHMPKIT